MSLKNVFGFVGEHTIELTPFTVLAGANGTGKTSFLSAIDYALGMKTDNPPPTMPCQLVTGVPHQVSAEIVFSPPPGSPQLPTQQAPIESVTFRDGSIRRGHRLRYSAVLQGDGKGRWNTLRTLETWKNQWRASTWIPIADASFFLPSQLAYPLGTTDSATGPSFLSQAVSARLKQMNIPLEQKAILKKRQVRDEVERGLGGLLGKIAPDLKPAFEWADDKGQFVTGLKDPRSGVFLEGILSSRGVGRALALLGALPGNDGLAAPMTDITGLLIDEVEDALHPTLLNTVVNALRPLSATRSVILTTHSPAVLSHARLTEILVTGSLEVDGTSGKATSHQIAPLAFSSAALLEAEFGSIGNVADASIMPGLVLEGFTDKAYVEHFALSPERDGQPHLNNLRLFIGRGDDVPKYSHFLKAHASKHGCLLDNDAKGQSMRAEIIGQFGSQVPAETLPWTGVIEDLFAVPDLIQAFAASYGLDAKDVDAELATIGGHERGFAGLDQLRRARGLPVRKAAMLSYLLQNNLKPRHDRLGMLRQTIQGLAKQIANHTFT